MRVPAATATGPRRGEFPVRRGYRHSWAVQCEGRTGYFGDPGSLILTDDSVRWCAGVCGLVCSGDVWPCPTLPMACSIEAKEDWSPESNDKKWEFVISYHQKA
ncbi:hypothetical protein J6590_018980 [Homalodisca vitripennis]|nr:hypothetical protein J6590_018980 [Homalodisca vitripennis]